MPTTSDSRRPTTVRALETALAIAVGIAFADSSIVVLALPELYVDFQTSVTEISWVVTAYNVVVAVAVLALLPFVHRFRPAPLAALGLIVFLGASIACAVSGNLASLVAGRSVQGLGAALLLSASLPLLVTLSGSRDRGVALWVGAGTFGVAVGPALGGLLTEAFSWRAIFVVQGPVAAAALVAVLVPRVRTARPPEEPPAGRLPLAAGLELAFLFAALVGALFLAVILVVTVLDYGPLQGAGIVSALPLAALAVRPLSRDLPGVTDLAGGTLLLAAGLVALALVPTANPVYLMLALAVSGAGLGLALPPLTHASLPADGDLARNGTFSVGARHVGLVIGLVAVAPLLASELDDGSRRSTLNGTAAILDAPLRLETKIPVALDMYEEFQRTPDGEIPDLSAPFDAHGALTDPDVREVRDTLLATVEAALTRAFRSSFLLSALFALLAGAAALVFRTRAEA